VAEPGRLGALLTGAFVAPEVFALRPDYRALLLVAEGIEPGPSDPASEQLLEQAESAARQRLAAQPVEDLPHVTAWRDAYRSFGAKPSRTRNSVEALLRRAATAGLPRVNRLTDLYNAISVLHEVPIGGEDADRYAGPPRLVRAEGTEVFDTVDAGREVLEHPDAGEVVWGDPEGVTCRRWNWRQGRRTRLLDDTTAALFIVDALAPLDDDGLAGVADRLEERLVLLGRDVAVARRTLAAPPAPTRGG
jgi:DNA/RNA-binding domain of Phe-tRNA-synthetase-like protein